LRNYEMMVIVRPDLDEEGLQAAITRVTDVITANGGEVTKTEPWGRRRLAYPIKQVREGQYVLMQFKLEAAATAAVERTLRINEDILRFLVVRLDDL